MTTGNPVTKGEKITPEKMNKKLEDLIRPVHSVTNADYYATADDDTILMNTGATDNVIYLPTAAGRTGKIYAVEKVDSGAGAAIVVPYGAETLLGYPNWPLTLAYDYMSFLSDGTNWV